ncbi:MAG: LysR family transcriptional regulator [Saccharospirillum sp.]|nr:LysR family transcriptional regulator [Saccharospirillum sp.]
MELRHLKAFRAVMQTGSTVEAAKLLKVSQPSVSRLISELEAITGERLFTRANGRLSPRESAELILPDIELALASVEGLHSRVERTALPLRIAAPAGVVTRIYGPAVRRLLQDSPQQKFVAEIMSYYEIVGAVASGRVDLGFVKAPAEHPALELIDLATVGTDVVLREDHPLATKHEISPRDLGTEKLILLGRNRPFRVQLDQIFLQEGITPNILIETQAVSAACSFVREGLGITIANSLLARAEAAQGLTCRPFTTAPQHQFMLAHLQRPSRARTLRTFARHVKEVANEILTRGDSSASTNAN